MNATARTWFVTLAACTAALALGQDGPSGPTAADLAGTWAGTATHEGETTPVALELEPGDDGKILIKASIPAIHLASQPRAASGEERFRVRVVEKPIERLAFDNPKSRFDRFGSDVTVSGGRLYLGTHDGRVLALEPAQGTRIWEFAAGDSVLARRR